jgi:hypothetical protein
MVSVGFKRGVRHGTPRGLGPSTGTSARRAGAGGKSNLLSFGEKLVPVLLGRLGGFASETLCLPVPDRRGRLH